MKTSIYCPAPETRPNCHVQLIELRQVIFLKVITVVIIDIPQCTYLTDYTYRAEVELECKGRDGVDFCGQNRLHYLTVLAEMDESLVDSV